MQGGSQWDGYTYITFLLLLNGLFNLNILNIVSRLDVENSVKVHSGLELADHKVILSGGLNILDRETADPGVGLAREGLGLDIAGLEIESILAVESKDLGGWQNVALVEDGQRSSLVGNVGGLLPGELDGIVDDVVDGEVTDAEDRGQDGAGEGATTGNGLILVESEGEGLSEEVADLLLEDWDTSAAANHFNAVDILRLELGVGKSLLKGNGHALKERLDHLLELFTLDERANVDIVHHGLDAQRGGSVGGEDLLELLSSSGHAHASLGVGVDVDLELFLELHGKVVDQGLVEVATTKVTVVRGALDIELTLAEFHNRARVVAVANVDKHDATGLLLSGGEVDLGDAVAESNRGGVVHEAQAIEAGNVRSIDNSSPLAVGEPWGNAEDDIDDGKFQLTGSGGLDFIQVHSHKLGRGKLFLLALVGHFDAGLAMDVDELGGIILLFDLDIGIVEGTTGKELQGADGVLDVGSFLGLGGLADESVLLAESD